ncbi:hypothetical protein Tco_0604483 [Tanacetum coccineum]
MLRVARVQIPENNLDDLQSSREEMEHQKLWIPKIDWVFLDVKTNVTNKLSVLITSRAVSSYGHISAVVVILVKGHAFPTIVKVRPVGLQVYPIFVNTFPVGFQTFLFELFFTDLDLYKHSHH